MIVTVTLNPAIDKTLTVPSFVLGEVNRASSVRLDPGGKAVNAAKVLHALGAEHIATGFLGGAAGRWILNALGDMGIRHDFIQIAAETRTNVKLVDPERNTYTDVNEPGGAVTPEELLLLREKLFSLVNPGDTVLFAGGSPAGVSDGFSAELARALMERGVRAAADLDGARLKRMCAERPFLIKPNEREFCGLMGLSRADTGALAPAALSLVARGISHVIVSRGEKGALFADEKGVLLGKTPCLKAAGTAGAGDAMTAGYLYALERGYGREDAAQLAVAAAAAKVLCPGGSPPTREQINARLATVELKALE